MLKNHDSCQTHKLISKILESLSLKEFIIGIFWQILGISHAKHPWRVRLDFTTLKFQFFGCRSMWQIWLAEFNSPNMNALVPVRNSRKFSPTPCSLPSTHHCTKMITTLEWSPSFVFCNWKQILLNSKISKVFWSRNQKFYGLKNFCPKKQREAFYLKNNIEHLSLARYFCYDPE